MSYLRQSGTVFLYRLVLVGVILLTEVALARTLGPSGKGYVAIFTITPVLIAVVAGSGLDYALNYFGHQRGVSRRGTFGRALRGGLVVALVLVLLLALDVAGLRSFLYRGAPPPYAAVELLSLGIVPAEVFFVLASMLAMTVGRPVLYGKVRVVRRALVLAAVLVAAVLASDDLSSAVLLIIAGQILAVGVAGSIPVLVHRANDEGEVPAFGDLFRYGLVSLPARLAERLQTRVDVVLLGLLASSSAVGVYTVAAGMAESLFYVSGSLNAVLFTKSAEEESDLHRLALRVMLPLGVLLALAMAGAAMLLVPLLFGSDFSTAVPLLWILLPGVIAFSLVHIATPYFVQQGLSGVVSAANTMGLTGNVGLNLLLIPDYGAFGAALASAVSYSVTGAWLLARMRRVEGESMRRVLLVRRSDIRRVTAAVKREMGKLTDPR